MKIITPSELAEWTHSGKKFQLIDVREEHECAECSIGGEHIPMAEVIARVGEIQQNIPVVIHCKSGRRSRAVVHILERKFGLENLYTLEGGIEAMLSYNGK